MPGATYGSEHKRARRAALDALVDGTPCYLCHRPMYIWQKLDLDHVVPVAFGGAEGPKVLVHRYCNRKAGAVIGNRSPKRRLKSRSGRATKRNLPKW